MEGYIRGIAKGKKKAEIAKAVSGHFGIGFTLSQCKAYMNNHGITSGIDCRFKEGNEPASKGKKMNPEQYGKCQATMFRKGNIPANRMAVGEHTHTTDGYLIRKVKGQGTQQERFESVHRATWEGHNGPVPDGMVVTFLDRDKDNCDIGNLVLASNAESLELNRSKLRSGHAPLTEVGVAVAKLRAKAREVAKAREEGINNGRTCQ